MENENLKVNSKTDILEFKRKHNLLVEIGTVKANVYNIKTLSNDVINNLRCGDVVLKEDSSGKHAYLVSFKSNSGLCLTYVDASCVETQSYDKSGDNWIYNSEDKIIFTKIQMENIVDNQGNNRFIEGDIDLNTDYALVEDLTKIYGKWSLSGTHLMFVLCLELTENVTYTAGQIAKITLPTWVMNKIVPLQGVEIEVKTFKAFGSDISTQDATVYIETYGGQVILYLSAITPSTNRKLRITFDLLIDNE